MRPDVERIFTKLSKNKVELGIMQDIISDYKKGLDLFTSAKSTMDKSSEILDATEKLYEKAERQAKDLGIDMPSQTSKLGNRIKETAKEARKFK
tara:strand:- start:1288 stop:1569 length:282 start_codon:yes stop_codon:yes gene_type:complete